MPLAPSLFSMLELSSTLLVQVWIGIVELLVGPKLDKLVATCSVDIK